MFDSIFSIVKKNNIAKSIIFFILLTVVYPPQSFYDFFPQSVKLVYRLSIILVIWAMYLMTIFINKQIDIYIALMFLYSIYQIIVTIINKEFIYAAVYCNTLIAISGLIVINFIFSNGVKFAIRIMFIYFLTFILLSLLFSKFLTNIMFEPWIIGRRTQFFLFIIPLLLVNYFWCIVNNNCKIITKRFIFTYLIIILITIVDFSSTLFCIELLIVLFGTYIIRYNNIKIKIYVYFAVYLIIFILFVLPFKDNMLLKVVTSVLHKSESASGRTPLYSIFINKIINGNICQKIFGYGVLTPQKYIELTKRNSSAHNLILQIIHDFGAVGLIFHTVQILVPCVSINGQKEKIKSLLNLFLFIVLLRGIYESYFYFDLMFILGLIYNFSGKIMFDYNNKKILVFKEKYCV